MKKAGACQKAVVRIAKKERGGDTADGVVEPESALEKVYELIGK